MSALAPAVESKTLERAEALAEMLTAPGPLIIAGRALPRDLLATFYAAEGYAGLWVGSEGLTARANTLIRTLTEAWREGLEPADYAAGEAARELVAEGREAAAELLLSGTLVRYATDLQTGRASPSAYDPELFEARRTVDEMGYLLGAAQAADFGSYLASLAPANPIYRNLRSTLARYRSLVSEGGWTSVPAGPALRQGMVDPRVEALRQRLAASGDLPFAFSAGTKFDAVLDQAARRFQERHGLPVDGVVARETLAALNVPLEGRMRQILLNMERFRWMPDTLGDRYVLVNIASFQLLAVEDGQVALDMRVVVGRNYRRTPTFSHRITYLDLNPYWNVPTSIATRDLLPKLRVDPNYFADQGIRVLDGWGEDAREVAPEVLLERGKAGILPYRLQQMPGPKNALGRIKFMFPNRYNVYLHDTPTPELFDRPVRTFNSGCIRVEQPLALAEFLLADTQHWYRAKIASAIDTRRTRTLPLPQPVPIHLVYVTAWTGLDGMVNFRDDVYSRDAYLAAALFKDTR